MHVFIRICVAIRMLDCRSWRQPVLACHPKLHPPESPFVGEMTQDTNLGSCSMRFGHLGCITDASLHTPASSLLIVLIASVRLLVHVCICRALWAVAGCLITPNALVHPLSPVSWAPAKRRDTCAVMSSARLGIAPPPWQGGCNCVVSRTS
jgi:hypothetical protein